MGWRLREGESEIATGRVAPDYELKKKSMEYIAHWNGKDQFEVESCYGDKHNLHLGEKTCSCRKWQLTGIPCAHAISGIYFMGYKPKDYVHEYYHKSNFLRVYNHLMMPLLGPEEWPYSDRPTLLPPISERMPGRPKKQDRRKTLDEMKNKTDEVTNCGEKRGKLGRQGLVMTCKTCHVAGHNKRTCPQNRKKNNQRNMLRCLQKEKRKANVLSQESKLTTSRRPLTRSVAAVEVLPLSQSSVTGPGTPSKQGRK
ncbi:UNVERIFIED_CONTAM: hypothetical protein Sangu_1200600 [Sesamum angustifolium]|uniref:SWIM-type domain-containing protein n=1 Tax=Sesamum angustifolium TaxID=2727405 RepID=A0AAW2NI50_9LAMI